jgi:hypothetical protein
MSGPARFVFTRPDVPADSARSSSQRSPIRIEYLDYLVEADYREYRLALHSQGDRVEVHLRIPVAAFAASRVPLQDGPDVCYQRMLRMISAGEEPSREVIVIDGTELAAYREAHTPAPRRSVPPQSPPKRPWTPLPERRPKLPVAAAASRPEIQPPFHEGQRVNHVIFGDGVTMASSGGRTSVQFDEHGVKSFVTSMLELELLSAPHEWEAGPRGKNRPRDKDSGSIAARKRHD